MRAIVQYFALPILFSLCGCASTAANGPGMTLAFGNGKLGTLLLVKKPVTDAGDDFPGPGSLSPERHPLQGGKVESASPDGRSLPRWVDFSWIEVPYESKREYTKVELDALPVHRVRVSVSDRVPADVIAEVIRSKQSAKTRDERLHLWLTFVWQRDGIAFGWRQYRGCCTVLRSGGDHID